MRKTIGPLILLLMLTSVAAVAQLRIEEVDVNETQVARWNRFVDELYATHLDLQAQYDIREEKRIGGYHRLPGFYEEIRYLDAASGRLLSMIQWERGPEKSFTDTIKSWFDDTPHAAARDRIHSIAVYFYDAAGRVIRDYSAAYLPEFRNAPIQTLVFLHHYNNGLHSHRAFDANGIRIYERCRGNYQGRTADIDLEEDDFYRLEGDPSSVLYSYSYKICFDPLPMSPGEFLSPH